MFRNEEKNPLLFVRLSYCISATLFFFAVAVLVHISSSLGPLFTLLFGFVHFTQSLQVAIVSFDFCFYFTTSLTTKFLFTPHGYSICWVYSSPSLSLSCVVCANSVPKYSNVFELTNRTHLQCLSYVQFHVWHCFLSSFSLNMRHTEDGRKRERLMRKSKKKTAITTSSSSKEPIIMKK